MEKKNKKPNTRVDENRAFYLCLLKHYRRVVKLIFCLSNLNENHIKTLIQNSRLIGIGDDGKNG